MPTSPGSQKNSPGSLKKREKLLALVDTKEATNHDLWFEDGDMAEHIPGTFTAESMVARTTVLPFGDVQVALPDFRYLLVELKTWDDLHAAVRDDGAGREDGRLRHQLAGLLEAQRRGAVPVVMLVGVVTLVGTKGARSKGVYVQNTGRRQQRPWSFFELEQTRATIQALGLMTYQVSSSNQIPHAIRLLADMLMKKHVFDPPGLPQVASLAPKLGFLTTALTAVPTIGVTTATAIANRYKTFDRFYKEATVKDLQQIAGVGKVLAERIWAAWHALEPDPDVDVADIDWSPR